MQPEKIADRAAAIYAHRWPAALDSLPYYDARQEAWLLARGYDGLDPERAALRIAYDLLKLAERLRANLTHVQSTEPSPPRDYRYLYDAIARLAPVEREIIRRHFWDNVPLYRVAGEMGVSERTVHRRYRKALAELREMIEGDPCGSPLCTARTHFVGHNNPPLPIGRKKLAQKPPSISTDH